ncbi:MAG: tellurite resistance TerB family protein [Rhizobiaceae bacterium]
MSQPTAQEVMIYLMVVVSASDNAMVDPELERIGSIIRSFPCFDGFDEDHVIPAAKACQKLLARDNGLNVVLTLAESTIPAHLRETAYALALEVAISDRAMRNEELRVLQLLRTRLRIDARIAEAVEIAARVRHRSA